MARRCERPSGLPVDVQTFVQSTAPACAVLVADRPFFIRSLLELLCPTVEKPRLTPPPLVSVFVGREDRGEDETSQPSADPAVHHAVQESESGLKEGLRYLP